MGVNRIGMLRTSQIAASIKYASVGCSIDSEPERAWMSAASSKSSSAWRDADISRDWFIVFMRSQTQDYLPCDREASPENEEDKQRTKSGVTRWSLSSGFCVESIAEDSPRIQMSDLS
jgi:hypothetical protein